MKKIIIEDAFWNLFPQGQIEVLVLKGVNNHSDQALELRQDALNQACKKAGDFLVEENFSQNQVIQEWRQAFTLFKTKKGARSSIEALLKRAGQGHEFRPINPLVDLYNAASLSYAVPTGGEDIDALEGDLRLDLAKGGEAFFPLGAEEDAPALEGELAYLDQAGAVCRCLNWREAQRTMLTDETTNAVLVMEAINPHQAQRAKEAMDFLQGLAQDFFKLEGRRASLTSTNPSFDLMD